MHYIRYTLILMLTLAFAPIQAQVANPCAYLFDEDTLPYRGCSELVQQRNQIAADDARVQQIAQRIGAISRSFTTNRTDPAWVQRITPEVNDLMAELNGIQATRRVYLSQARAIEIALSLYSGVSIPQAALDLLLVDIPAQNETLLDMAAVESDGVVLQTDLASVAPAPANPGPPADPPAEPEAEVEFGPAPEPPTNQEVLSLANAICSRLDEPALRNACIFRTGLVWLQAQEECAGSNNPDCLDAAVTRINTQERTEEDWERLIEQMNALDDPYAAVAVSLCQLNPSTDENGVPISLGQCAQAEYLEIADDVNGDADADGLVNVDDFCPNIPAGNTPDPTAPDCPLSDDVAQRDGDGILNRDDLCPEATPGNTPDPDRTGCPLPTPDWSILSGNWSFYYTPDCNNPDTGVAQLTVNGDRGFWTYGSTTFPFVLVDESAGSPVFFTDYGSGVTATWVLTSQDTLVGTLSNGTGNCRLIVNR
jgi:hypothetical protein